MTPAEMRLIEEAWQSLVERLGWTEATRVVLLLDRRTGGALQHLQALASGARAYQRPQPPARRMQPSTSFYEYADEQAVLDQHSYT